MSPKVMIIMTSRWVRWQDWVALVAGVYAFLSPLWTTTVHKASVTLVVLGVVTALVALVSLAAPGMLGPDGAIAVLGVLLFVSPWVMGFHATTGISWTAWIVGVVTVAAGATALPLESRAHRDVGRTPLASH